MFLLTFCSQKTGESSEKLFEGGMALGAEEAGMVSLLGYSWAKCAGGK